MWVLKPSVNASLWQHNFPRILKLSDLPLSNFVGAPPFPPPDRAALRRFVPRQISKLSRTWLSRRSDSRSRRPRQGPEAGPEPATRPHAGTRGRTVTLPPRGQGAGGEHGIWPEGSRHLHGGGPPFVGCNVV